jgi:hypothetical protein
MHYFCRFWVLIAFTFSYYGSPGQEKFVAISGKVLEAGTRKPVPFANVQLQSGSSGTASNVEGEFLFKIPERLRKDTLVISCVGYRTCKKLVHPENVFETIVLEPAAMELKEVTVNSEGGLELLKRVLAKIPENYDTTDHRLTAFYRENIRLGDFQLSFNEAVLDIHKTFKTDKKTLNDQIRVIKGRKKKIDYAADPQLYHWIGGISNGARGSLGNDLVKYRMANFNPFNPKNYRYYDYEYGEIIHEADRDLIVLNILPKKNSRKALFRLKLFIDEISLVIVKYDFDLTEAGVNYVSRKDKGLPYLIMSTVVGATCDYYRFQISVTYKQYEQKWYVNTITRRLEILMSSKKRKMVDRPWLTETDFMVTDINTRDVAPITQGDIGKSEMSMGHLIGNNVDEAFWEHYNILKPVIPDSLKIKPIMWDTLRDTPTDTVSVKPSKRVSNRKNGFTRADTLRGRLSPLRSCYDVTFYHLDVAVNMDQHSLKGSNTIRFKVLDPFRVMQVDLYANMKIEKVLLSGRPLEYTREHDAVFIHFPEALKKGSQSEIIIFYEGIPKIPDWSVPMNGGVLWDKDEQGNAWAQVVCQGSGASLWWPNKDHLSDEPDSMKIWITVPARFTEISNGRLIRKTQLPGEQTRYEWFVSYPINNYNVTFNIGMYAHYSDLYIKEDTLTIDYYVMAYNLGKARSMFRQVKPMLDCFERSFGKYPFPRDGFTLVESLYPMEHQSGVCIGKITEQNSGDTNPLLWHESAHEWWGNAISCKDMADLWFHEAFATYAEALMVESLMGKDAATKYINDLQGGVKNAEPIIGVHDVNHIFYDIGDMYEKGCLMLNTFRHVLNDDTLWFTLLRDIQQRFRHVTLSSDELVAYINQRTAHDYTYFFDQYLKRITLPTLEIALKEEGTNLIVKYRWQMVAQEFRMPVQITTATDRYDVIYPVPEWKTITLKNMTADHFEVAEDKFFIEVKEVE